MPGASPGVSKMHGPELREARRRPLPARRSLSASSITPRPATRWPRARSAATGWSPSSPIRRCWRSSIAAKERKDDVKLGQALNKLVEEDPSITIVHNPDTHEVILWGQGEMHLRVAAERLTDRFGIAIEQHAPSVGYRETISKTDPAARPPQEAVRRARPVRRCGAGHQAAAARFAASPSTEKITGGVVPRNYIPSVEEGVIDGAKHGPLGFPVVDLAVTLIDGSFHTVDSSDMAFRTAGRIGVVRGAAAMPAGAAGADPFGRDRLPERRDGEDQRHPVRTARSDPRLRHARGLARLGLGEGDDAGIGDRRSHRRGAFGDGGRRHFHSSITWPNPPAAPRIKSSRQDARRSRPTSKIPFKCECNTGFRIIIRASYRLRAFFTANRFPLSRKMLWRSKSLAILTLGPAWLAVLP